MRLARALVLLAGRGLGSQRRDWAAAMEAELDEAAADGRALPFAAGCLLAALRTLPMHEEGRFTITAHALALGLMIPMAAVQIGCALFGFPYLFPGQDGPAGALLLGAAQQGLFRSLYLAAVPALTLLLLALGAAHLRMAWAMLDGDWERVGRTAAFALAVAVTLIAVLGVLFLDPSRAVLQSAMLTLELAIAWHVYRWHATLPGLPEPDPPR